MNNILAILIIFFSVIFNLNAKDLIIKKNNYVVIDKNGELFSENSISLDSDYIECINSDVCLSILIKNAVNKDYISNLIKYYELNSKIFSCKINKNDSDYFIKLITFENQAISIKLIRFIFIEENLLIVNFSKNFNQLAHPDDIGGWMTINSMRKERQIMNLQILKQE